MKHLGKKLLLTALVLLMLAGLAVVCTAAEPDYFIDSISLLDTGFHPLDEIPTDEFYVEISVTNLQSETKDALLVGTYAEDGRMLSLDFLFAKSAVGQNLTFGTGLDNRQGEIAQIKAFVVDALGSMSPLAVPCTYPMAEEQEYVLALTGGTGYVSVLTLEGAVEEVWVSQAVAAGKVYQVQDTANGVTTLELASYTTQSNVELAAGTTRVGDLLVSASTRIAAQFIDGTAASYQGTENVPAMVAPAVFAVAENGVARAVFCPEAIPGSDVTKNEDYVDALGRPGVQYMKGSKVLYTKMETPLIVKENGTVSTKDVYAVTGKIARDLVDKTSFYINGTTGSLATNAKKAFTDSKNDTTFRTFGTKGAVTEFYWNEEEQEGSVVIYTERLGIVSAVSSDKKTVTINSWDQSKTDYIGSEIATKTYTSASSLKKGDLVTYIRGTDWVSIEKAELKRVVAQGGVTYKAGTSVVMSTLYTSEGNMTGGYHNHWQAAYWNFGSTYDLALNSFGSVLGGKKVVAAAEEAKYLYVLDTAVQGSLFGDATYLSKVLFNDGTVEIVKTNKDYAKATGLYSYTVAKEVYTLTAADLDAAAVTSITQGKADFGSFYFNKKTLFVVETTVGGKSVYTVYTGIGNVPTLTGDVYYVTNGSVITQVFAMNATEAAVSTGETGLALLYLPSTLNLEIETLSDGSVIRFRTAKAFVNGEFANVKLSDEVYTALRAAVVGDVVLIDGWVPDDNGILTEVSVTNLTTASVTTKYSDGVMGLSGTMTAVDETIPVYLLETSSKAMELHQVANVTTAFKGWVVRDENGNVTAFYGTDKISAAPVATAPVTASGSSSTVVLVKEIVSTDSGVEVTVVNTAGVQSVISQAQAPAGLGVGRRISNAGVVTVVTDSTQGLSNVAVTRGEKTIGGLTVPAAATFVVEENGVYTVYGGIYAVPDLVCGTLYYDSGVCFCLNAERQPETQLSYTSRVRFRDALGRPGWSYLDAAGKEVARVIDTPVIVKGTGNISTRDVYAVTGFTGKELVDGGMVSFYGEGRVTARNESYAATSQSGWTGHSLCRNAAVSFAMSSTASASRSFGSSGVSTEFYWNAVLQEATVVLSVERLGVITAVNTGNGTVTVAKWDQTADRYMGLPVVSTGDDTDYSLSTYAGTGFTKGQLVIYCTGVNADGTTVIADLAPAVIKNVTARGGVVYQGKTVVMTYYTDLGTFKNSYPNAWTVDHWQVGGAYELALNRFGFVLGGKLYEAPAAEAKYLYVLDTAVECAIFGDATYLAKVLFEDGTVWIIETNKDMMKTTGLYSYTVQGEVYALTAVDTDKAAVTSITQGKADFDGSHYFNNSTVFVVETAVGSEKIYNIYTGIKNVPSVTGDLYYTAVDGRITLIFAMNAVETDPAMDGNKYLYLMDTAVETANSGEETYLAKVLFADGTVKIVETDKDYAETTGLYSYTVESEIYTLSAVDLDAASGTAITQGKAVFGSTNKYFDDDTLFVVETTVGSEKVYNAYTGIGNVPSLTGDVYYAAVNSRITCVFAMNAAETVEAPAETGYLYVMDTAIRATSFGDATYLAKVLMADGTIEIVETKMDYAKVTGLYAYSAAKEVYTLTAVDLDAASVNTITQGQAAFAGSHYFNNKTLFVVETVDGSEKVYTTYTGIGNVPTLTGDVYYVANGSVIIQVFAMNATEETVEAVTELDVSVLYVPNYPTEHEGKIIKADANGDPYTYYNVKAIINGTVTTVDIDETVYAQLKCDAAHEHSATACYTVVNGLAFIDSYVLDANGVICKVTEASLETITMQKIGTATKYYSDGVIDARIGSGDQTKIAIEADVSAYIFDIKDKKFEVKTVADLSVAAFQGYVLIEDGEIVAFYGIDNNI